VAELQAVVADEAAAAQQAATAGQQLSALLARRHAALYDVDVQLALEAGQVEALVGAALFALKCRRTRLAAVQRA
jgi:hypothetical protein